MKIVIDAVGIRGHGGAAVLCELLHWLPRVRPDWLWHVFMFERHLREFDDTPVANSVTIEQTQRGDGGLGRLQWVNRELQERIRSLDADVLFSFANIGSASPSIPQVVFVQQRNAFFAGETPGNSIVTRLRLLFMRHQIMRGALASRAVVVQTDAMRSVIQNIEPNLKGRIHIIPSGYRTASANPQIRPEKKGIVDNASRPRLIYVTHPSEHKNHVNLVKALPGIIKVFPDASLLLTLEKDVPPDPRYKAFVREIIDTAVSLKVSDRIIWTGILTADEVHYALSNSDLMVFPSLSESFGLGLVEAMAAGCPVAASDLGYAHDVMNGAGNYFDANNPDNISDVVISALSDTNKLISSQREAASMMKKYSYEHIADQIADLFNLVREDISYQRSSG